MMAPQRGEDGKLTLALAMGDSELAGIAAEDIGKTAYGIFKRGTELVGRTVSIAGEHLTGAEIAAAHEQGAGRRGGLRACALRRDACTAVARRRGAGNMFQFYAEVPQFVAARDLDVVRGLNPDLLTFEQWLDKHKSALSGV